MKMKLQYLKIRNFMGCKELDIEFNGADMKIFGDNATGKTTLMHAFNWLLFDKNAYGKTDFGIKPFDESGEVIHRLETSVEAMFDIDGNPKQFKKVLREKWTRKRGSAEDTYSGNEIDYYVNTVPKKKKEFTEEIAKVIEESVFRTITNPLYFNENIEWKARRKMLLEICGNINDEDVIDSDRDLEPLKALLQGRTVEELKSIVSSEMKNINKELGIIPSRIAEAELAKPKLRNDVDASELDTLQEQRTALLKKRSDILNGAEILRMKAKLDNLESAYKDAEKEEWSKYGVAEYKEMSDLANQIRKLEMEIENVANGVPQIVRQMDANKKRKQQLSDEWDEVFKQAFLGTTCPTCKQELPPEQLEAKKREFNRKKAEKLDDIESELNAIKKHDNDLVFKKSEMTASVEQLETQNVANKNRMAELQQALADKEADFRIQKSGILKDLSEKIRELKNDIMEQELNAEDLAKSVELEIQEVESKIKPINDFIAEQAMIERQNTRIEELKESQKKLSVEYSNLERQHFLTEQFIQQKVRLIDAKINSRFEYARFKLFDRQVNGGIVETCEATYKGVPYKDLNTAGRINIGLDIINTLSTAYNVVAPIFIDNMESITKPIDTVAQRIELIVSEQDKDLRFEAK